MKVTFEKVVRVELDDDGRRIALVVAGASGEHGLVFPREAVPIVLSAMLSAEEEAARAAGVDGPKQVLGATHAGAIAMPDGRVCLGLGLSGGGRFSVAMTRGLARQLAAELSAWGSATDHGASEAH